LTKLDPGTRESEKYSTYVSLLFAVAGDSVFMRGVTPEHICGLVVGEGCFYVESAADSKYRSGWRIRPAFCVEMRGDDREVLEELQKHLGCGEIYELDFGRYRGYEDKGWRPHAKYRVGSIRDLNSKVVPFFRHHQLFGRKHHAFELFAEIVTRVARKEHLTDEGLKRLRNLAEKLGEHNRRG
jgi:hypothetical protein